MKRISISLLLAATCAVPACSNDVTGSTGGDDDTGPGPGSDTGTGSGTGSGSGSGSGSSATGDQWDQIISMRVKDYSAALRIAALRLTGALPSIDEITAVSAAPDDGKQAAYETVIRAYMTRPEYANQVFKFWQDQFKIGGTAAYDTAPAFAAKLSVENGSYLDLFTKATGNCPTFDATAGTFTDAECANGGPKAGVLTNPGVMTSFFSNFAFRRTRWVQETFDCLRFPAELTSTPKDVGGASPYLGVWDFNSISSPTNGGGRVNFQDVTSAICENCHTTINHIAPLFAYYDVTGAYKTTISVPTPLDKAPLAVLTDYIPATETTAWRYQKPAADLPALGMQMAADPDVAACGVARVWNWAMGHQDVVDALETVPRTTIDAQVTAFTTGGYKMKDLIFAVFTSDDFIKF